MTDTYLPYDYARCTGVVEGGRLHFICKDCMRRLSPGRKEYQSYFIGIVLEDGGCSSKICVKREVL